MFNQICTTYDLVNRAMTLGLDQKWRRTLTRHLPHTKGTLQLLDCATGTGDQIFALMRSGRIAKATGVDLAESMLALAETKRCTLPFASQIELLVADVLQLPFAPQAFDCVTISFGIRNVIDVPMGLREMHRVLKPGGRLLVLECSLPKHPLPRALHLFYLRHILPRIGGRLSKHREAYTYLNQTIETFPCGNAFCALMSEAGFTNVRAHPMAFGAITLYQGDRQAL